MSQTKLNKRQLEVLYDLLESEDKEAVVLQKHKVSWLTYNKWLSDENFIEELDNRITTAKKRAAAHLAGNATKAIANLLRLSKLDGETARKACLDIIALQSQAITQIEPQPKNIEQPQSPAPTLSPETASRILAALAEENEN